MSEHVCVALDANGERYTDHCFAGFGAPWRGATILLPGAVADLRKRGLLPLTEVSNCATTEATS